MKEHKEIFVSVELIKDIHSEEIVSELMERFGYDFEKDHIFYKIPIGLGKADAEPIDIDKAISILQELKNENSTHVQIEYNPHHREYIFSGIRIELATEELIDKYKKYREERKELEETIIIKELEIFELRNKIKKFII